LMKRELPISPIPANQMRVVYAGAVNPQILILHDDFGK